MRKEEKLLENHIPIQEIHTEASSLRILKIMPRNLKEIVRASLLNIEFLYLKTTF